MTHPQRSSYVLRRPTCTVHRSITIRSHVTHLTRDSGVTFGCNKCQELIEIMLSGSLVLFTLVCRQAATEDAWMNKGAWFVARAPHSVPFAALLLSFCSGMCVCVRFLLHFSLSSIALSPPKRGNVYDERDEQSELWQDLVHSDGEMTDWIRAQRERKQKGDSYGEQVDATR